MENTKYSHLINSVNYGLLRNNERSFYREMFRTYADNAMKNGNTSQSICDLYNKTFQMNIDGFVEYAETKMPKKYMVECFNYWKQFFC